MTSAARAFPAAPSGGTRLLVLLTDAFGGRGGIAKFNCDLLKTLCLHPGVIEVTALPRIIFEKFGVLPVGLAYEAAAARGKPAYLYQLAKLMARRRRFGGVVCGHINLLPLGVVAARRYRVPLILVIHGIDAWQPPAIPGLRGFLRRVDSFVSVSAFTKQRFLEWAPLRQEQGHVIPNCVDLSKFGAGPKPLYLLQRYGLSGRRTIMTLARLSAADRYKGVDEVLDVVPSLVQEVPDLAYLIVGEGEDRGRLQEKVARLRISNHVVFTGYTPEAEKADHYRLADAFVMPGRCEGFGIVYLEAMACGVPVVGSKADASREAVLNGKLGQIVDPGNPEEIRTAILEALQRPCRIPEGLKHFSFEQFVERWHIFLQHALPDLSSLARVFSPMYTSGAE